MTVAVEPGCVYVVATPIGNLQDLSPRAVDVLKAVDVIACEDTRHTARLCRAHGISTRRLSLHAHNERTRIPGLLSRLRAGETVALVSDAGTPLVSDPGERLVRAAIEAGVRVVPIPGPSAVLAALVASGFATQPFTFAGFLPRGGSARRRALDALARCPGTLVLFEAPRRVGATLSALHAALGPRRVAVARELTKRFEELVRGRLGSLELPELRGEVTLVIEGAGREPVAGPEELDAHAERLLAEGASPRDAARALAEAFGVSRSDAYARVLARRKRAR